MPFPDLQPGEVVLPVNDDLMYRNVHPGFYDQGAGLVSSQAFTPNGDDQGCMSVTQGTLVSAFDAFLDYTVERGRQSVGVWAFTTSEVDTTGSRSVDDRSRHDLDPATLPPGHAYVDFRDLGGRSKQETRRGRRLRDAAQVRGCQYLHQ
jgi:hypothetical protein